jgi:hypothetical protein
MAKKAWKIAIFPAILNMGNAKSFPIIEPIKIGKVWKLL